VEPPRRHGRAALAATLSGVAVGIALLIGASNRLYLAGFVAVFGLTVGAPLP
jgi:hypothetical protein